MFDPLLDDFNRSQADHRITSAVMIVGVFASLALAFPFVFGLPMTLREPVMFPAPVIGAWVLSRVLVFGRDVLHDRSARRRATRRRS